MKALAMTLLLGGLAFQATASANEAVVTAHIAADGKVIKQSTQWIKSVELKSQPDYFSQYKLALDPAQWKEAPGFCVASPIDASTEPRLMHGQAKVVGAPPRPMSRSIRSWWIPMVQVATATWNSW